MEPAKLRYWILGWFSMALCCYCTSDTFTQRDNHPHAWKKLYLAHHWPVTVCKMIANDCHDPPKYWTIHGLWPDRAEDCNRTWHFNVTEIKDLLSDMRHYWPDVLHSSLNRTQFWKHEWDKHGTCAASLEVLNSQKKYFGKALELYQHVDLNGCLLKAGIKPGSTYYKMTDIKEVLTRFYGVTPKIQCLPPEEGEEAQTIGQIEFCFTKELQLINCTALKSESIPVQAHLKLGAEELSVTCLVDVGKDVDIVYVDFNGAFDTISHSTLLEKLTAHGLDRDDTHSQSRALSVAFHQNVYGFKSWIKSV